MNGLNIFFNTEVKHSGTLACIGDIGLTPVRYLFNGSTISKINLRPSNEIAIHHVASFHKNGIENISRTHYLLKSSSTGMIKAALSIVFLIPGLIIGAAFKGAAYLFSNVRATHSLVKLHFTPISRTIGSVNKPITNADQLNRALRDEASTTPTNQLTDTLIIHGDGKLKINEDPGILRFNPMKLILVGAQIVHKPTLHGKLDDALCDSGNWESSVVRDGGSSGSTFVKIQQCTSIADALRAQAPRRGRLTCKRYHQIFQVPSPQPQTS